MNHPLFANEQGRFGQFGGMYVPELLITPLQDLINAWQRMKQDTAFQATLMQLLLNYAGRPTPLTEVPRFAAAIPGLQQARVFLKREDLLHTGAHKINNALGQCLLAKQLGKQRVIAETGAGQHGVATAAACAHLGLTCVVYMGATDVQRQQPNVARMTLMGAEVIPVMQGAATLKEAVNEALRDWSASFADSYYCLGSALGPHPYPEMVATFQSVIGEECAKQCQTQFMDQPDIVLACVGGGSNAIGIFSAFVQHAKVRLIGVEGGGHGSQLGEHAARFQQLTPGVLHGCYSYVLQDKHGQIAPTASISAGLDYPSVGPQHAHLFATHRAEYHYARDEAALAALQLLARTEGILCALESAHALAYLIEMAPTIAPGQRIVVNLSGRGDKDLAQIMALTSGETA